MKANLKSGHFAYVAIATSKTLGIAVRDEPGYYATDLEYGTYGEAETAAKALNEKLGLTERQAVEIVCSSMRLGRARSA